MRALVSLGLVVGLASGSLGTAALAAPGQGEEPTADEQPTPENAETATMTKESSPAPRQDRVPTADGSELHAIVYGDLEAGATPVVIPNAVYLEPDFLPLAADRPVIFYDLRNRGRSASIDDPEKLGIHQDVADMEAVRRHFGIERMHLVGHSYLGLAVILYALEHPERVDRVVQIGPLAPTSEIVQQGRQRFMDPEEVDVEALTRITGELQGGASQKSPREFFHRYWEVFLPPMLGNPELAPKVTLPPDDLPNEWIHNMYATVGRIFASLGEYDYLEDAGRVKRPVLTVHGTADRSASIEGGRAWAAGLGEARILEVAGAGHLPWVEAPDLVLPAIRQFLAGEWPEGAVRVGS